MKTTALYTLSLHDALPISRSPVRGPIADDQRLLPPGFRKRIGVDHPPLTAGRAVAGDRRLLPPGFRKRAGVDHPPPTRRGPLDRKSTRLNSSHVENSYAVF